MCPLQHQEMAKATHNRMVPPPQVTVKRKVGYSCTSDWDTEDEEWTTDGFESAGDSMVSSQMKRLKIEREDDGDVDEIERFLNNA